MLQQADSNEKHPCTQFPIIFYNPANHLQRFNLVKFESRRDDSMVADKMKNEIQPRRGEIIKQILWQIPVFNQTLTICFLNLVIHNAASTRLLKGVSLLFYHNFAPPALFYPAVAC
jgi:hypothetical protein